MVKNMNFWIKKDTQYLYISTNFDIEVPFEFSLGAYRHYIFDKKAIRLNLFLCLMFDYINNSTGDSSVPEFIDNLWNDKEIHDLLL